MKERGMSMREAYADALGQTGKAVVFTGAMRPERFRQSDAAFHLGGAVAA